VVLRTAAHSFQVVAEDPVVRTIPLSALSTFQVRIPVAGGERLALWPSSPAAENQYCAFDTGVPADVQESPQDPVPEPQPETTVVTDRSDAGRRTNVSAVLEADADGDHYGDETQDQCPTVATAQGPCPPPETTLTKKPKAKTKKRKAKFAFNSDQPAAMFECKLDGGHYSSCTSPHVVSVSTGKHKFRVKALNPDTVDATPAQYSWKVKKKHGKHSHHGGHGH
jgi:hypothetical protein